MRVWRDFLKSGGHDKIYAGEIQVSKFLNLMDAVIVEEGSNDKGYWTKFGNGQMIQVMTRQQKDLQFNSTANFGPFHRSVTSYRLDYPIPFKDDTNTSLVQFERGNMGYLIELPMYGATTTQSSQVQFLSINNNSGTIYLKGIAIGPWK